MFRILAVVFSMLLSVPAFAAETNAKAFGCADGLWKFAVHLWSLEKIPDPTRMEVNNFVQYEHLQVYRSFPREYGTRLRMKLVPRSERGFAATFRMGSEEMTMEAKDGVAVFRFPEVTGNIVVTVDIPDGELLSPPNDGRGKRITFLTKEWDTWIDRKARVCQKNTHFLVK